MADTDQERGDPAGAGWGEGAGSSDVLTGERPDRGRGVLGFFKELPVLIIVAFAIAIILRTFVVQAFFIPSRSMVPTLEVGDRVLVSKFLYWFTDPKRGDVMVFRSSNQPPPAPDRGPVGNALDWVGQVVGIRPSERDLIKRVIGTEGQTIQIKEGRLFIDGKRTDEDYLTDPEPMPDYGPFKVPRDSIFVMGDNRSNSQDSRVFGAVNKNQIIGRAFILIWPLNRIDLL